MNRLFFKTILFFVIIFVVSISILSTTGITTNKFNSFILKKIDNNYQDTKLKLEKIKFKFDFKNISLFIETKNPEIIFTKI